MPEIKGCAGKISDNRVLLRVSKIRRKSWPRWARESGYSVRKLAELLGISVRQLERYVSNDFNQTPKKWLQDQKMAEAQELLLKTRNVSEVALALGFTHSTHFSRAFKKAFHVSPIEYIRTNLSDEIVAQN